MPALFLALDAEKVFDCIHWTYPNQVLKKFGFSGHILSSIMALYTFPSAQVFMAGMLSKAFLSTNGTRQGRPLSLLIFNLLMEPLALYICSLPDITGFQIGRCFHSVSLFADDIILMLTNPAPSLGAVQNALHLVLTVSYYKVNTIKLY